MEMYKKNMLSPDHLYPLIGRKIRYIRKQQNMTQEQLAEMIDGDQKYISKIEAGKARPGLSLYLKIANVFQVSIDYFLIDAIEVKSQSIDTEDTILSALGDDERRLAHEILDTIFQYLSDKK